MTVKELKELLADMPDDMEVLIPTESFFNGLFVSPCMVESGEIDIHGEKEQEAFALVPCGFFELNNEDDEDILHFPPPELN